MTPDIRTENIRGMFFKPWKPNEISWHYGNIFWFANKTPQCNHFWDIWMKCKCEVKVRSFFVFRNAKFSNSPTEPWHHRDTHRPMSVFNKSIDALIYNYKNIQILRFFIDLLIYLACATGLHASKASQPSISMANGTKTINLWRNYCSKAAGK